MANSALKEDSVASIREACKALFFTSAIPDMIKK